MKKNILLFTSLLSSFLFWGNTTFAFDTSYIRNDLLNNYIKISANPCQTPCTQHVQEKLPCAKTCDNCDKDIKMLYEFFSKADCQVSLTPEQKNCSTQIKRNAANEITEIKRNRVQNQNELLTLENSSLCCSEKNKLQRKLNREIRKSNNAIKKVYRNADREYREILNSEQKKLYRNYKNELKNDTNICSRY